MTMLHAGTSGYSYAPWKGRFYPPRLPAAEMLAFYARHFDTVEINSSFYRVPARSTLEKWAAQVPDSFRFAFKAPRRLTHDHELRDSEGAVAFLQALAGLGACRGPVLFQLPPRFAADLSRLDAFLAALPPEPPVAFEFRHASWFTEAVFDCLRGHGAALCLAQTEAFDTPWVATADFGYLRLRHPCYGDTELDEVLARVAAAPWRETYVFFKHEDEARGPELAARLLALAGQRT